MLTVCGGPAVLLFGLSALLPAEGDALRFLPGAILLFVTLLFPTLTVTVDERDVQARFGAGLIGKRIPLSGIESCRPALNCWWWGWGIRLCPGTGAGAPGWMYNVSGLQSVELRLKNGASFRIGTDEPERLCEAITQRLQAP